MKAEEVLSQYAEGERNFHNANLRGANFRGQDLSGADFSGADIRSANFIGATLRKVNFMSAQAGLQHRYTFMCRTLILFSSVLSGLFQGLLSSYIDYALVFESTESTVTGFVYILFVITSYYAVGRQGFTGETLTWILAALSLSFVGVSVFAEVSQVTGFGFLVVIAFVCATVVSVITTLLTVFMFAGDGLMSSWLLAISTIVTFLVAVTSSIATALFRELPITAAFANASLSVAIVFSFSIHIAWQTIRENKKFTAIRPYILGLCSSVGSSFQGADLTEAIFDYAELKCVTFTDLRAQKTNLHHVSWRNTKNINFAYFGETILQDYRVRTLLSMPKKGYKKDFSDADFRGANLSGVTLEGANLTRAVLSDALLTGAILEDAILTEAQAINTDFTGAYLTGATLESWNINSTTTLKNIDCEYVFLREIYNKRGDRERRPHHPNDEFQSGDFEKLFKEVLDDVQILIRDGVDPVAFRAAFQQLRKQNPDILEDAVKSVEKKSKDLWLLTLQVLKGTDKAKIVQVWKRAYQLGLKEGRTAAMLEGAQETRQLLKEITLSAVQQPLNIYNQNKNQAMTFNDQSQRINIQRNVNQSAVTLGDSNQISNQINQLGKTEAQAQLKNLLSQLQSAIESEPTLSEEERTKALVGVGRLAAAGQSPTDGPMKKAAKRSLNALKGITLGLDETTKLATTAKGLLNAIALLFGL